MLTAATTDSARPKISARVALGTTRLAVGVSALLAPRTAVRVFGMDPDRSNGFIGRLFGSRELALALLLLRSRGDDVRTVATVGAAIDAVDVVSSLVEARGGRLSTYALVAGGGGAALFMALGLQAVREQPRDAGVGALA